jgi:hypothetical protein
VIFSESATLGLLIALRLSFFISPSYHHPYGWQIDGLYVSNQKTKMTRSMMMMRVPTPMYIFISFASLTLKEDG